MKRYVVGFVFCGDWVLLLKKKRPAWQAGKLNGPGGHIEEGETDIEAMRREFLEEVGKDLTDWKHFATLAGVEPESGPFEVVFFRLEFPEARGKLFLKAPHSGFMPDSEREDPTWAIAERLPSNVLPNLYWLIPLANPRCEKDWPYLVVERARRDDNIPEGEGRVDVDLPEPEEEAHTDTGHPGGVRD